MYRSMAHQSSVEASSLLAATLSASLVQSRLDYANSVMYGMSASNMHKLYSLPRILLLVWFCLLFAIFQQVRNLVTSIGFLFTTKQFIIATFTYKTLATCQASYFYNLLQLHQPSRALRSSTQHLYAKYHICLPISVSPHSPAH